MLSRFRHHAPRPFVTGSLLLLAVAFSTQAWAQCPEEPQLQNYTGAGVTVCPCFIPGEEAGSIFNLPAEDFPIEILRVGIGWGSLFGGAPDVLEQSIHIYEGGLPDPGAPVFSIDGPQLTDGVINEFNLEPLPGEIVINSGPFTVTLEFFNSNTGDASLSPSVVHDGNGCQPGKNVVFAAPGGWNDACPLGVTGDWLFYVVYRPVVCAGAGSGEVPDGVTGIPLEVDRLGPANLLLTWDNSCTVTDDDYEVYQGSVGSYYSHVSVLCSTGSATAAVFLLPGGSAYYLVVPQNGTSEGNYGQDGSGTPRPPAPAACLPQVVAVCP